MTEPRRGTDVTGRKRLRQTKLDSCFITKKRRTSDGVTVDAASQRLKVAETKSTLLGALDKEDSQAPQEESPQSATPVGSRPVNPPVLSDKTAQPVGNHLISEQSEMEEPGLSEVDARRQPTSPSVGGNGGPPKQEAEPAAGKEVERFGGRKIDKRHSWAPGVLLAGNAGAGTLRCGDQGGGLDPQSLGDLTVEESPPMDYNSSQSLFSESDSQEDSQTLPYTIAEGVDNIDKGVCFGTPLDQLRRAPGCSCPLPALRPVKDFTILFRTELTEGEVPRPFPENYQDRWDSFHVRMPCSKENLYPVKDANGKSEVKSRWELMQTSLLNNISSSLDLEESILAYNTRYNKRWNFQAIHHYFTEVLDREDTLYFFKTVLPGIVRLALELPKICTKPIPLLKKQMNHTILLSQHQIASLLANAFFCTFPRRNAQLKKSEYSSYPDINFNRLFDGRSSRKKEKLKCIINYFRRVTSKTPCGTVSFTRRALRQEQLPDWSTSQAKLGALHVSSRGNIETDGTGMLQLDFANAFIGGGVLGHGCVQEEIRFLICPELIVSRLFTEVLAKNECLVMKGAEQYSSYCGYANTFKWTGDHDDVTPRDKWGRRETEIVAIDALPPNMAPRQYLPPQLKRELDKAYCGFHGNQTQKVELPAIATGNWGCGAFGGNPRLKALLQLMAAAEAHREVAYFTFHDNDLCRDIHNMHHFLQSQDVTVGELLSVLVKYSKHIQQRQKEFHPKLYPFIFDVFTNYDSDTEDSNAAPPNQPDTQGTGSPDYKVDTP